MTHLRPFWWAYALASAVMLVSFKASGEISGPRALTMGTAAFVQCITLCVLYRQPPRFKDGGGWALFQAVLFGAFLFVLFFNPGSIALIGGLSMGVAFIIWVVFVPLVVLPKTYRLFVRGAPSERRSAILRGARSQPSVHRPPL